MENVIEAPIQDWLSSSTATRSASEYARKSRAEKVSKCARTPLGITQQKGAITCYGPKHAKMLAGNWKSKSVLGSGILRIVAAARVPTLEAKFRELAFEWLRDAESVSSMSALTSHPKYREIVSLGWSIVPMMLGELRQGRGWWIPALGEITQIRPFDPRDAGNLARMTQAWINWGKSRKII